MTIAIDTRGRTLELWNPFLDEEIEAEPDPFDAIVAELSSPRPEPLEVLWTRPAVVEQPAEKLKLVKRIVWSLALVAALLGWMQTLAPRSVRGPAGYVVVRGISMLPTFQPGDLVITQKHATYGSGDIVSYRVPKDQFGAGIVVIHRIVGGNARDGFVMLGDNNTEKDDWHPKPADIVGKAWLHVPRLGLVLVFLHAPVPMGSLAAGIAVAFIMFPKKPDETKS